MSDKKAIATPGYTGLRDVPLTCAQAAAVDALAAGNTDEAVATYAGVHRVTVTRWRLYNPRFQAALNARRQEVWAASLDRLQALVPVAVQALAGVLADPTHKDRAAAALKLLQLVLPAPAPPAGPTDPAEIVAAVVQARRDATRDPVADLMDGIDGRPDFDRQCRAVWAELEAKSPADEPTAAELPPG